VLSRGQQMLNVVREVDEASRRSGELGASASSTRPVALDLELLAALAEESSDTEVVMERLVSGARND
jgi:hypothetical protein